VKQDPRPIGDKNFLNSCMRTVIAYLSTHGYPYAISPKLLASPTGKDFTQIVQFLFQRFDPALKAFGKVEDEVPLFFKRLNYPFQVRHTLAASGRACASRTARRSNPAGWQPPCACRFPRAPCSRSARRTAGLACWPPSPGWWSCWIMRSVQRQRRVGAAGAWAPPPRTCPCHPPLPACAISVIATHGVAERAAGAGACGCRRLRAGPP
jgi:hypothetical protein